VEQKEREYQELLEQKEELARKLKQLETELKQREAKEIQAAQQKQEETRHLHEDAAQSQQQPDTPQPFELSPYYNPSGSAVTFNPFKYLRKNQ
jgi:chromosome segregation ATPase